MNHLNLKSLDQSTNAVRTNTAFEAARDTQTERLDHLQDLITNLEQRLAPVLGSDVSDAEPDAYEKLSSDAAPVILNMAHVTSRIDATSDRVRSLLNRLCL